MPVNDLRTLRGLAHGCRCWHRAPPAPARWNECLADELVVLTVGSDPEPMNARGDRKTERSVVQANADTVEATVTYDLEVQGGMCWL